MKKPTDMLLKCGVGFKTLLVKSFCLRKDAAAQAFNECEIQVKIWWWLVITKSVHSSAT